MTMLLGLGNVFREVGNETCYTILSINKDKTVTVLMTDDEENKKILTLNLLTAEKMVENTVKL